MNHKKPWQQAANNHRVSPNETAWLRLDAKLEKNRSAKKISKYKYISIAAVMLGLAGVMSLFFTQKQWINGSNLDHQNYTLQILDHEDTSAIGLYELGQLRRLKMAYAKISDKTKI